MYDESLRRRQDSPIILKVQVHERTHVKLLEMPKGQAFFLDLVSGPEHIAMLLPPRRVVDFGNNGLDTSRIFVSEAEVQVNRAEVVSQTAPLRQQANWTSSRLVCNLLNTFPHGRFQGRLAASQVVGTIDRRPVKSSVGQQRQLAKQPRKFRQIHVEIRHAVGELTYYGLEPPMPDVSLVDATVHESMVLPKCRHTVNALRTPSS